MGKTKKRLNLDAQWYLPKRKKAFATSTKATKDLVDILSHEDKTRTIEDVYNLINYDEEAKEILKTYIDKGYGNEIASEWFGFQYRNNDI